MALSELTTQQVMAGLNQEFNIGDADPLDASIVGFWQSRLRLSGMTQENAQQLVKQFCAQWGGSKPCLHDLCTWIAGELRKQHGRPAQSFMLADDAHAQALNLEYVASPAFGRMVERMRATLRKAQAHAQ